MLLTYSHLSMSPDFKAVKENDGCYPTLKLSHYSTLKFSLICFPLVSVLALYRADHFNSFLFFFLESIFCFAVSFSARKQHMSQSAVIRSWPPFQTKINTAHLRLFPLAHMPLKFFLCVSQMETCRACASQEAAADACPEHLETCSEHQGACVLLSWLSFLCTFQNWGVLCFERRQWGAHLVVWPQWALWELTSSHEEAFWDGRKSETFLVKKHKLTFLSRWGWDCERRLRWPGRF